MRTGDDHTYELLTAWRFDAPLERVWDAVCDCEAWPLCMAGTHGQARHLACCVYSDRIPLHGARRPSRIVAALAFVPRLVVIPGLRIEPLELRSRIQRE